MSKGINPSAEETRFFNGLREHLSAPKYNYTSTDMLTPERLETVRAFERAVRSQRFWQPVTHPDWLFAFVERTYRDVPYYRGQGRPPRTFETIPTVNREVLRVEPWSLVPDTIGLDAMTVYTTSGTTGSELAIPTDPTVSSMYLVLLEQLLEPHGVALPRGPDQVAIALMHCQQTTLTYPSISHFLGGAGFLKLNLAPHEWRDSEDRARFLRDAAPAVITGCPYAFEVLSQVVPDLRPRAMVSSAVAMHPGQAARLEGMFGCPVLDLYSMTEARAIAGRRPGQEEEMVLLSHDLYVEILGPDDESLPLGEVGEIVLTGGRNPYFPLLRYRTGDRAALAFVKGRPHLRRFEGRQAVHLETTHGQAVPTLDVVNALRDLPLVGFSLLQKADRTLAFEYCGASAVQDVKSVLEDLFEIEVALRKVSTWEGKPHRFRSELTLS